MREKSTDEVIRKTKKSINVTESIGEVLVGGGCMFTAAALVALMMGGVGEVVGGVSMIKTTREKTKTQEFQEFASAKKQELLQKFSSGEISYEEFKKEYENVDGTSGLREFAQTNNDKELNKFFDAYDKTKDFTNVTVGQGFTRLGAVGLSGLGLGAVAYTAAKSQRKKLENLRKKKDEEIMSSVDEELIQE